MTKFADLHTQATDNARLANDRKAEAARFAAPFEAIKKNARRNAQTMSQAKGFLTYA
jgi:hypothetical protein